MTCAPVFPTPATELAELAVECMDIARHDGALFSASTPGLAMRDALTEHARNLGIPAGEIEAAVDAAIKAASGAT